MQDITQNELTQVDGGIFPVLIVAAVAVHEVGAVVMFGALAFTTGFLVGSAGYAVADYYINQQ